MNDFYGVPQGHKLYLLCMNLPVRLTATPEQVAADILRAVEKKSGVVYTRWFWRWIMAVIRAIPEGVFQKMRGL